jgi:hypothetical protein
MLRCHGQELVQQEQDILTNVKLNKVLNSSSVQKILKMPTTTALTEESIQSRQEKGEVGLMNLQFSEDDVVVEYNKDSPPPTKITLVIVQRS